MSIDLSDPDIAAAFRAVVDHDELDWLLLCYASDLSLLADGAPEPAPRHTPDRLVVLDTGAGGIAGLRTRITDAEIVYVALYKARGRGEPSFALISHLPPSLPAVRKARALVHARRVSALFHTVQPLSVTLDTLDDLTADHIHHTLYADVTTIPSIHSTSEIDYPIASNIAVVDTSTGAYPDPPASGEPKSHTSDDFDPYVSVDPNASDPVNLNLENSVDTDPKPSLEINSRASVDTNPPTSAVVITSIDHNPSTSVDPKPDTSVDTHSSVDRNLNHSVEPISGTTQVKSPPPPLEPLAPMRRSLSESPTSPTSPRAAAKLGMLTQILRWKRRNATHTPLPPPTPPKDKGKDKDSNFMHVVIDPAHPRGMSASALGKPRAARDSLAEFAFISHAYVASAAAPEPVRTPPPRRMAVQSKSLPARPGRPASKWAVDADPAERARRRAEAQRQQEMELEEAARAEAEWRAQRQREKAEALQREAREDEHRRALFEIEIRHATAERRRRERQAQEEEEQRRREIEERKKLDRERRIEEGRRMEEWRREQARMAEETARQAEAARRKEEEERRARIRLVEAKFKRNADGEEAFVTGWVTIQTHDSLIWRRRFYRFEDSTVLFYKSAKDTGQAMDSVNLRGRIRGLREWNEGFEELGAIPHSFAIEFSDGQGAWSMYADSEEEKDQLLGLLHHAAGL